MDLTNIFAKMSTQEYENLKSTKTVSGPVSMSKFIIDKREIYI